MNGKTEATVSRSGVAVDLARLESCLAAAPRVIAATVFGSAREGWVQPGSDLDVAVLFDRPLAAAFFSLVCREYEDVMANREDQRRGAA